MVANRSVCFLALCWLFAASGCASSGLLKLGKSDIPKAGPENPVTQIVALWQPGDGIGLDGKASRGFAGQILFLTHQSEIPAEVNGDVRIYVFDDQGSPEQRTKPFHQFDFPADVWKTYLREGKLGRSYALFIPYTRKGRHEAECSLRVRYTAPDGRVAFSEMINVSLLGTKTKDNAETREAGEESAPVVRRSAAAGKHQRTARQVRSDDEYASEDDEFVPAQATRSARANADTRPAPVPMNAAERQRIVREALARMARENREHGAMTDDGLTEDDDRPRERRASHKSRISHALAESDDEGEADDAPRVRRNTGAARSAPIQRLSYDLDDEEAGEDADRPVRSAPSAPRSKSRAKPSRHLLEQADGADEVRAERHANTYTIPVPRMPRTR